MLSLSKQGHSFKLAHTVVFFPRSTAWIKCKHLTAHCHINAIARAPAFIESLLSLLHFYIYNTICSLAPTESNPG